MKSRTVLITGTSSGIGKELTTQFAQKGFNIIVTARNPEALSDLSFDNIRTVKLDVTSEDDIRSLTQYLESEKISVDILINNAGFGMMGPAAETSVEDYKKIFETNFFGQIKFTQAIIPFMPKSEESRIVNVGSVSGVLTTPFASPYCSSKAALNSFSDALRMELKPLRIKVVSVQPGAIKSKFGKNAVEATSKVLKSTSIYKEFEEVIVKRAMASQKMAMDVEVFVKKLIAAITRRNPPALFRAGKLSFVAPFLKKCFPERIIDKVLMKIFGF